MIQFETLCKLWYNIYEHAVAFIKMNRRIIVVSNIDMAKESVNRNVEDISENVNSKICSECGGRCCKQCGCFFSPYDFKEISFEFLKKEIEEKGYISIGYVDPDKSKMTFDVFILRIRNQGKPVVDTSYGRKQCILLTEQGCKLDYKHRPTGGKLLIPSKEGPCISKYTLMDCAKEWQSYQRVIFELMEYFEGKEIPCSL